MVNHPHNCNYGSIKYIFCVVASNGRLDRMFQVLPEQEESISVGDMLSDGILIVEHETPPCSPAGLILEITE